MNDVKDIMRGVEEYHEWCGGISCVVCRNIMSDVEEYYEWCEGIS